ncbi:hypothetical protein DPMN_148549 [Dreissena polymorpha]|uniref:Uncharacterized protein n=1 Tax=Dreissena polymorpha TaxID=45954 RepID=A0A9D4J3Z3_DREPO|nr:hypothetical protein DPMN_148549 [Dreissena polymorpha]
MSYSTVLLIAALLSNWKNAASQTNIVFNTYSLSKFADITSIVVDAFELGKGIYEAASASALETAKNEIIKKIDTVQLSVEKLHQTVLNVFAQLQLQLTFKEVDDFERSTQNRLILAENIVTARSTEKTTRYGFFETGMSDYLEKLYNVIPYVTKSSLSNQQSPLEMMRQKTNCDLKQMHEFNTFIHNQVLSGISIETIHKKYKLSTITLDTEKTYWDTKLKEFNDAVAVQNKTCLDQFVSLYTVDIKLINDSLDTILGNIQSRYADKLHLIIKLNGNEIKVSNTSASTFVCVESGGCSTICYIFYKAGSACNEMVAFQIIGTNIYEYKNSDGKFAIQR